MIKKTIMITVLLLLVSSCGKKDELEYKAFNVLKNSLIQKKTLVLCQKVEKMKGPNQIL